jgi:hypothetical protein
MDLRRDEWADLSGDGQRGGLLVPIFALAHEHDPDPTMRPYNESITCVDAKARLASVLLLSGRAATAMSNGRQNRPIPAHHCREIGRLIARQEQENVEIGFHSLPAALVYGFRWRDQGANAGGAHHYRNCQSFYGWSGGHRPRAGFGSPSEEAARGDRSCGYRPVRRCGDAPITRALRCCASLRGVV